MKGWVIGVIVAALLAVGIPGCWFVGQAMGWVGEAATVAREQFGPRALLKKYEWFKDALASVNKFDANTKVYAQRIKSLREDYKDKSMPRDERETLRQWRSELAGIVAARNGVAADYNAQMAKFNYRFTNVGDLPKGATDVLPREVVPYKEKDL